MLRSTCQSTRTGDAGAHQTPGCSWLMGNLQLAQGLGFHQDAFHLWGISLLEARETLLEEAKCLTPAF